MKKSNKSTAITLSDFYYEVTELERKRPSLRIIERRYMRPSHSISEQNDKSLYRGQRTLEYPHEFTQTFKPAWCDFCKKSFSKGLRCKNCSYRCHKECESSVPSSCCSYFQSALNNPKPEFRHSPEEEEEDHEEEDHEAHDEGKMFFHGKWCCGQTERTSYSKTCHERAKLELGAIPSSKDEPAL